MASFELSFPGSPDVALSARQVDLAEGLSMPFEVTIVAASPDPDLSFDRLVGAEARVRVEGGALGSRSWTGLCSSIQQIGAEVLGLALYAVRVVPRLWLLGERRNHRVFSHLSAVEIAKTLLSEWSIDLELRLTGPEPPRHPVRIQHGESDLAFLSRQLEDAGISYVLEERTKDDETRSVVVLVDEPQRAEARAVPIPLLDELDPDGPSLADARVACETRTGTLTLAEYDFRRPRYEPRFTAGLAAPGEVELEQFVYAEGAALVDTPKPSEEISETPVADREARTRVDTHEGQALAMRSLESARLERAHVEVRTSLVDLAPGQVFAMSGATRPELADDRRFVVSNVSLQATIPGAIRAIVGAAFADTAVRPARKTKRPRVLGVESAIVVGPEGEEIHTDELGRVKVRFMWDREHGDDDARSTWLRVDQASAGAGFGAMTLPRVGHEVLVAFQGGDPDHPIVVGSLYGTSTPPPYALPSAKAKTTLRTRTPGESGHNEVTLDDRKGHELFMVRAERDLHRIVARASIERIGKERATTVAKNDSLTVGGAVAITAGQMHAVRAASSSVPAENPEAPPNLGPSRTHHEVLASRITLTSGGATIQLDGPNITVSAEKGLRIEAGGTVFIQGEPYVQINPPVPVAPGETTPAPEPDHLVWFQLVSEGQPLAGVRCQIERADGTCATQVTDGNGMVRLPVDVADSHAIHIGAPKPKPAAQGAGGGGATAPVKAAPAEPAAAPEPASAPVRAKVGDTPAQPTKNAKPTQHEVPITFEIVEPKPDAVYDIAPGSVPTPNPSMPTIPLHARVLVNGEPVAVGTVKWEAKIRGQYRVRSDRSYRQQEYAFTAGSATTKPNEEKKVELTPGDLVGGALELRATFHGGAELGDLTAQKTVRGCRVRGVNPARADVEALIVELGGDLSWAFLRIFCHESLHRLQQFATGSGGGNRPGDPLYGPPSGVGIVQRDPTAEEWRFPESRITQPNNFFPRIFWDWKKNVAEGIDSFRSDYMNRGRTEIAGLRRRHPHLPEPPEALILRSAIRHYNGGNEFAASPDGRHYIVSPSRTNNPGYVDSVLDDPHIDAQKYPVPAVARARIWPERR